VSDTHVAGPIGVLVAGRFRIERLIGNGGMASVYQATDVELGRSVALKLFRSDTADPAESDRQSGEVAVLASLNHFALVTLYDAGTAVVDDIKRTFIVMEFVDGPDLRSRIAGGRLPASEVAELGADLAEALHYVHSRGVIHRDIKPANVLLAPSDFPGRVSHAKLADFGIARLLDSTRLTATGALLGTASYLSPEQALGTAIGGASDVYSLGLVLLECLTGERAYPGTAVESAIARLQRQPEIPADLGPEWRAVLEGMLNREPEVRMTAGNAAVALRSLVGVSVALRPDTELFASGASDSRSGQSTEPLMAGADDVTALLPASSTAGTSAVTELLPAGSARASASENAAGRPSGASPAGDVTAPTALHEIQPPNPATVDRPGRPPRTRRLVAALVAVAVLVIAVLALVFAFRADPPAPPSPSYPAVEGDLGTHLKELQESVKP
jgi:eukaryotic-like serine/threonine-protein kinase